MGIFDAIKDVGSAAVKTAVLPVSAAADFVTLGGLNTDRKEPYTATNAKRIAEKLSDAYDEVMDD